MHSYAVIYIKLLKCQKRGIINQFRHADDAKIGAVEAIYIEALNDPQAIDISWLARKLWVQLSLLFPLPGAERSDPKYTTELLMDRNQASPFDVSW